MRTRTVIGALVGAGTALAGHAVTKRANPQRQREGAAIGLVLAAGIYPLARRGRAGNAAEVATLAAATGLAGASLVMPERRGRMLLAIAWLTLGLRRRDRLLRVAALVLLTLVTVKVFLIDVAALGGLLRILSLMGLGVALIGIGWAYNRIVAKPHGKP